MNESSWFESWFNSPYYHLLYRDRDESEARPFIEGLTHHLQLPPRAHVLDLACGKGRHSLRLAELGYEVLGIDIAPENIAYAQQFERPGLRFQVHDMREPLDAAPFDVVLNLFTSFGYFDQEEEHQAAIHTMASALKPEGKLVIDFLNAKYTIDRLIPKEERTIDGIDFQIHRRTEGLQVIKEIRIRDPRNSSTEAFSEQVTAFRLEDFQRMLHKEDMEVKEVFGDYALSAFDPTESPRLIMVCTRSNH